MKIDEDIFYITTVRNTDELPCPEWDGLAGENIFMRLGWLRTLERTLIETGYPVYVLVRDSDKLLAAAACYIQNRKDHFLGIDDTLLGRFKRVFPKLGMSFRPALVSPLRFASRCPIMIRQGLASSGRRQVLEVLLDEIEKHAKSHRISTAFSTSSEDSDLNTALQGRGYTRAMDVPIAYLDIEWEDFSEYIGHLKKTSRKIARNIKWEINKNHRSGIRLQLVHGRTGLDASLMKFFKLNHSKYERGPFKYDDSFLCELEKNMGDHVAIMLATKESRPVGATLMLTGGGKNHLMMTGVDHELSRAELTYFNLNIYEQIKHAISSGSKRIYFGQGAYDLKVRRGCKVIDTYTYFKPVGLRHRLMTRLWFPVLSAWVKAKLPVRIYANNTELG